MLDKLIQTQKDNNARLASIEQSINRLVSINAREAKARRRCSSSCRQHGAAREKGKQQAPAAAVAAEERAERRTSRTFCKRCWVQQSTRQDRTGCSARVGGLIKALSDKKTRDAIGNFFGQAFRKGVEVLKPLLIGAYKRRVSYSLDFARKAGEVFTNLLQAMRGTG